MKKKTAIISAVCLVAVMVTIGIIVMACDAFGLIRPKSVSGSIPAITRKNIPNLKVIKSEQQELPSQTLPGEKLPSKKRTICENPDDKSTYTFDEKDRLVAYKIADLEPPAVNEAKTVTELPEEVNEYLSSVIQNYSSFNITSISETEWKGHYISMERVIGDGIKDTLVVSLDPYQKLTWFVVNYCNLDHISSEQINLFEEKLVRYMELISEYDKYESEVQYSMESGRVIANYTVTITEHDGAQYVETVAFAD